MAYAPSPSIPPGMQPSAWKNVVMAASKEAASLAAKAQAGEKLPRDVAVRVALFQQQIGDLSALGNDAAAITDYVMSQDLGPHLANSLTALNGSLPAHAGAAAKSTSDYLARHGFEAGANVDALQAVAQRSTQAMTHDWEQLTESARTAVREGVTRGMVAGLNPAEVARRVQKEVANAGGMTYGRALLIARTEMADCADAAVMPTIQGTEGVVGWTFDAQADACATCQIMHGMVFEVTDLPQRHHNCRCVVVPVFDDEGARPPDYLPGQQRDRADIESRLPKSWQPLPEDLRTMVDLRDNPGWRPSRTLRKPPHTLGLAQPPGPPLTRHPLTDVTVKKPTFEQYMAEHHPPEYHMDPAYHRREEARLQQYLEAAEAEAATARRHAADSPNPIYADWARDKDKEAKRWRAQLATAKRERASVEKWGATLSEVSRYRRDWKNSTPWWTYDNGHGIKITVNPLHASTSTVARAGADNTLSAIYDALDRMPVNLRNRVNLADLGIEVGEYDSGAAWAYTGTMQRPRLGSSVNWFAHDHGGQREASSSGGYKTKGRDILGAEGFDERSATMIHEFGHILDHLTDEESAQLLRDALALAGGDAKSAQYNLEKMLSGYGTKNGRELVAEAFVDYVAGMDTPIVRLIAERLGWPRG